MVKYKGERRVGPMLVICPEHAVLAPEENVIYQALAISHWNAPIFVLGGSSWPEGLEPYQEDYVNSLEAVTEKEKSIWLRCGSSVSDLEVGTRMLIRHRTFRDACSGDRFGVSVCGAYTEAHVRRVVELLHQSGIDALIHSVSIAYADINPGAVRALS